MTESVTENGLKINYISETVVKPRKSLQEIQARRTLEGSNRPRKRCAKKALDFVRAEQIVKKHRLQVRDQNRVLRVQKKLKLLKSKHDYRDFNCTDIILVVRIAQSKDACSATKKRLYSIGLRSIFTATILPNNQETLNLLKFIEPFVTYGIPSRKTIHNLVYKHGILNNEGEKIPLANNRIVEDLLGNFGIICVEDIVHEIFVCGDNLKTVLTHLWPFQLSSPSKPFPKILLPYNNGKGHFGSRNDIDSLLESMT